MNVCRSLLLVCILLLSSHSASAQVFLHFTPNLKLDTLQITPNSYPLRFNFSDSTLLQNFSAPSKHSNTAFHKLEPEEHAAVDPGILIVPNSNQVPSGIVIFPKNSVDPGMIYDPGPLPSELQQFTQKLPKLYTPRNK